jgi:hypothetical protein
VWSDGVDVVTNFEKNPSTVTARHQVQYAGGVEFRPRRSSRCSSTWWGGTYSGRGRLLNDGPPPNAWCVTFVRSAVALPEGIQKLTLVPGLKVNLKAAFCSPERLTALYDTGLHARFTPAGTRSDFLVGTVRAPAILQRAI